MAQERVYTSNHISQGDKCTGSKHKKEHTEVLGIERGAEYGTSAEQFADSAKQSESQGETDAAAQSVEGGVEYSVAALMASCSRVTKVAMTTMKTGIRTLSGTRLFIIEITVLEHISTAAVARPIIRPFMAEEVVPKVAHIPSRSTNTGLAGSMPFQIISSLRFMVD